MKKTITYAFCLTILLSFGFTSCKKKGCTDPTATNYNESAEKDDGSCDYSSIAAGPPTYIPNFSGEYGALIAIKTSNTIDNPVIGEMDQDIGTAAAVFSNNGGDSNVSAGTVKVNSTELDFFTSTNSYVYSMTGQTLDPTGIEFSSSGSVTWDVSGSSNWPAANLTSDRGFTTVNKITSDDPSTSSSYTLTAGSISGADSILYTVIGTNDSHIKIVPGNVYSYTFTESEMSTIGQGTGFVQVVGLRYYLTQDSGKDYYLINETVRTKQVNIN